MTDLKRKMKTNLDIVMLDKCENNSEAAVLPEDSLCKYLYQPVEQNGN